MNAKFNGMAAIHKAAIAGKIPVLKALVELGADVELEVILHCNGFCQFNMIIIHCISCRMGLDKELFITVQLG